MSNENRISDSLVDELNEHLDTVVVIFTESGCFTGLLVGVSDDAIKLITRGLECRSPFNFFGKTTIIRIREITAITFCNSSL